MQTLQLINPRRRGAAKRKARKHRTAAQRAATARMLAANRARRHNPRKRRHASVKHHAAPARVYRRRRNPAPRKSAGRSARRSGFSMPRMGGFVSAVKPAVFGAVGAVAVQAVSNFVAPNLPAQLQTGYGRHALNAGLAFALGKFGGRVLGAKAAQMAAGAMVVIAYQVVRDLAAGQGVNLGLSGMGWSGPAVTFNPVHQLPARMGGPGMGEYFVNEADTGANAGAMGEYTY